MITSRSALVACLITPLLVVSSLAGDNLSSYLTKDGSLTESLEVFDLQGGIAGFTGTFVVIHQDGSWRTGQMLLEKMTEERSGKLGKDDVAKLAKTLAAQDVLKLESKGEADVNPHVVTIRFGKASGTLTLPAGQALPPVDAKAGKLSVEQRYAAIVDAVKQLTAKK